MARCWRGSDSVAKLQHEKAIAHYLNEPEVALMNVAAIKVRLENLHEEKAKLNVHCGPRRTNSFP